MTMDLLSCPGCGRDIEDYASQVVELEAKLEQKKTELRNAREQIHDFELARAENTNGEERVAKIIAKYVAILLCTLAVSGAGCNAIKYIYKQEVPPPIEASTKAEELQIIGDIFEGCIEAAENQEEREACIRLVTEVTGQPSSPSYVEEQTDLPVITLGSSLSEDMCNGEIE